MFGNNQTSLKHVGVISCSMTDKYKTFQLVESLIKSQIDSKLTILTVNIHKNDYGDELVQFLNKLVMSDLVVKNQIKITVLGKWYDLQSDLVESIKKVINETKDYDKHFLNLCINYDGQESILDACKMIARMTKANKIDPDAITKEEIKDNIYSSFFIPPDLIIKTGKIKRLKGFLLWDSSLSLIHFTEKPWSEFNGKEMENIIKKY